MRKSIMYAGLAGATAATVIVSGGLVASGAWFVSGSSQNTNNGKATHVSVLTVSASSTSTGWYPQLANVPVTVNVTNTNPFHIVINDVKVTGYTSDDSTCAADLAAAPAGVFSGENSSPALALNNSGNGNVTVNTSVSNDLPNSCQDKNFTITFTATGASS